ncbi:MAG: DUF1552 domain-containing protein [Phycisphaerae bacterium]
MSKSRHLTRRTMLRGFGTAMALPFLDAMSGGSVARAAGAAAGKLAGGAAGSATPTRLAWFFVPNGVNMEFWRPKADGALGALPPSLAPLAKAKDYLTVVSGLALDGARAKGDGPGDHARSAAAFLTGAHPTKTSGSGIKNGVSIDQAIANNAAAPTRFQSLELGLDRGDTAGNCDSGYSCAYVSNISWRSETAPMPKEHNPGAVFDRLFGNGSAESAEAREKRLRMRKSVLDFVAEDSKRLEATLGRDDKQKLDEYQTALREIERRIERARQGEQNLPKPEAPRPDATPKDMAEHFKLMSDLLWVAWRTDQTRLTTFMIARDGSNRSYPQLGIKEGHHSVSHHGRAAAKIEAIRKIDLYHMELLASFVERLRTTPEGSGNMLDNSLIMLGSGIGDGDRHNHDDLPVVLLGKGGGAVKPGRHLSYARNTPMCNLYLNMADAMGAKLTRFGDSDGRLKELA